MGVEQENFLRPRLLRKVHAPRGHSKVRREHVRNGPSIALPTRETSTERVARKIL